MTSKEYHKKYYLDNKDKIKQRARDHYAANREKHDNQARQYLRDHFEFQLYRNAKSSAITRGLEFNINVTDIIIPTHCPYLGIELTRIVNGGRQETNASLDRIDNNKGYTKDNIQVISSKANFMKRNASIEELITFAKGVLKVHSDSP